MKHESAKVDLKGLDPQETEDWVVSLGLEPYRARQIRQWVFKRLAGTFDEMTNLAKTLRFSLSEKARLTRLREVETLISSDGTMKYLFGLSDGHLIESVLIPERDHHTLCISSQVGCAMGCRFCLTAAQGLKRNLSASEIIEQVIHIKRSLSHPERLTNIVFMGMGEPLANYASVKKALINLIGGEGMDFSRRKVTLSTCGLVPYMKRLGEEVEVKLAVSLNAADNNTRSMLMPVNRDYPLEALLRACRVFPLRKGDRITFEYILIKGMNDRDADALKLVNILSGIRAKVNLIPFNVYPGSDMSPPSMERLLSFQDILLKRHLTAIVRKSRGRDIRAACGQLSGESRNALSVSPHRPL